MTSLKYGNILTSFRLGFPHNLYTGILKMCDVINEWPFTPINIVKYFCYHSYHADT